MSNQEQSPFDPQEPDKKTEEARDGAAEPASPPPPPERPTVELERYDRVPSPDIQAARPVETFEREGVLPSFSDRRPPPAPPPSPVEPVSPAPSAPPAAPPPPTPPISDQPAAPPPPIAAQPSVPPPPPVPASPAAPPATPAPPPPPAMQQQPAAETAPASDAESLEHAKKQLESLKSRNKILKYILVALTVIVLMIAGAIAFLYNKIATFFPSGETYQSGAMESFSSDPAAALRALPGLQQVAGQGSAQGGSSLFLIKGSGGGGASGDAQLPVPQVPQLSKEEAAAMNAAMARFAERPLVKEFIEDLKRDPVVGDAFRSGKKPTPADFVLVMNNPASVRLITEKYATRPEFMALMMEFINDPALKPMLGNMQGMGLPQPPRETSALPAPGGDDGPQLDTNAVSGPPSKRRMTTKKVPSPGSGD